MAKPVARRGRRLPETVAQVAAITRGFKKQNKWTYEDFASAINSTLQTRGRSRQSVAQWGAGLRCPDTAFLELLAIKGDGALVEGWVKPVLELLRDGDDDVIIIATSGDSFKD